MAKWFCKLEIVTVVEADTEEQAKEEFAFTYRYAPHDVHQLDDDEPASLKWRDKSFTIDGETGKVTWADPQYGLMAEAMRRYGVS